MLNDSKRFDRKHQKGNLTSGGLQELLKEMQCFLILLASE